MESFVSVELEPTINIRNIESLKSQLDGVIDHQCNVTISANKVEKVDTACLQLLVAFNEKLKSNGFSMAIEDPSDEMSAVIKLLGLESALGLSNS